MKAIHMFRTSSKKRTGRKFICASIFLVPLCHTYLLSYFLTYLGAGSKIPIEHTSGLANTCKKGNVLPKYVSKYWWESKPLQFSASSLKLTVTSFQAVSISPCFLKLHWRPYSKFITVKTFPFSFRDQSIKLDRSDWRLLFGIMNPWVSFRINPTNKPLYDFTISSCPRVFGWYFKPYIQKNFCMVAIQASERKIFLSVIKSLRWEAARPFALWLYLNWRTRVLVFWYSLEHGSKGNEFACSAL